MMTNRQRLHWILGLGLVVAFGGINRLWHEFNSLIDDDPAI